MLVTNEKIYIHYEMAKLNREEQKKMQQKKQSLAGSTPVLD